MYKSNQSFPYSHVSFDMQSACMLMCKNPCAHGRAHTYSTQNYAITEQKIKWKRQFSDWLNLGKLFFPMDTKQQNVIITKSSKILF